ncbi:mercury transporter MerT [Ectothiorhodospiraceae bacterium WFHF3C12]|nr:mercury transporter MerT [Ectothiorhodospiraceae bacterium WFHF3C12]
MDRTGDGSSIGIGDGASSPRSSEGRTGLLAAASVLGSVLASACCIMPLALFSVGISGAWMANLTALAPYKPLFVLLAGGLILAGFISMRRRRRRSCDINGYCASDLSMRITTGALCFSTLVVIAVLLWPYLVPMLVGG